MVFEYLTVLISVVVGLTVTSFLTNVVRIIHVRGDVTISWVQLLWSAAILSWTIAFWWFTFVLAEQRQWTFPLFVFLLAYATLLSKSIAVGGGQTHTIKNFLKSSVSTQGLKAWVGVQEDQPAITLH